MKTLAFVNLKGGVGKTVSAANMAHILASVHNKRVLLVDADKQGNASQYFKLYGQQEGTGELLLGGDLDTESVERAIYHTQFKGLDIITSNMELYSADRALYDQQDADTAKALFSALQNERPQTMALVLSYVDPDKAAGVIEQLEPRRQIRVVEAIATMESASPAAIKTIEAEMERKFSSIITQSNVKVGGIDYVAGIMNNLDRSSEKSIFDGLSAHNSELADEIRKRMFVFEDIITMDDRSVQRFVRDCDPRDLVLALKTANADVANKLFTNMSARMAESIRDDLEVTTNVRMKDVEDAQQRIVGVIRDLEERNEIIIMKGGKDDIIA